jgi:hypothetical protein
MKHTWKRLLGVSLALMLLLSSLAFGSFADSELLQISAEQRKTQEKPEGADALQFRADGTFTIVQVTDTQEIFTTSTMTKDFFNWLAGEVDPDLFILTGDNISDGGAVTGIPAMNRWVVNGSIDRLMNIFDGIGVPTTMVLGNHDAEASGVTRWQEVQRYQDHTSYIGFAAEGAEENNNKHWGTHNLLLKDSKGVNDIYNLWLFDSGDYAADIGYNCVTKTQVDWFNKTSKDLGNLPSLAFQHIVPIDVFNYLDPATEGEPGAIQKTLVETTVVNGVTVAKTEDVPTLDEEGNPVLDDEGNPVTTKQYVDDGGKYYKLPAGTVGELNEGPCPSYYNFGQFAALKAAGVQALFVGHDHVNTYELATNGGPIIINSPCSGFGSYGIRELRGVRVITLHEDDLTKFDTSLVTYADYANAAGAITSTLQNWRLTMMHNDGARGSGFVVLDWIIFKPWIWLLSLLGL